MINVNSDGAEIITLFTINYKLISLYVYNLLVITYQSLLISYHLIIGSLLQP